MKHKNLLFSLCVGFMIVFISSGLLAGIYRRANRKAIQVPIDPAQPSVALTFDDGPNLRYTPQVLDILYEQQVPATFFLVGEKFPGNERMIKEMASSGHELENHTFSHPDLMTLDRLLIQQEIKKTEDRLKKILPDYHMKYVRPPYGRYTKEIEDTIKCPLMLWTIDSLDWKEPNADHIYASVVSHIQDGDIVVFHDNNAQTVEALKKIISELKARGFQFVTVSQIPKKGH